jgi:hypothetical protein
MDTATRARRRHDERQARLDSQATDLDQGLREQVEELAELKSKAIDDVMDRVDSKRDDK